MFVLQFSQVKKITVFYNYCVVNSRGYESSTPQKKKMKATATTLLLAATGCSAVSIPLVTFDNAPGTTHTFSELNDPVMGGKSTGTFSITKNSTGLFQGEVNVVPKLKAPGFIETWADDHSKHPYADASSAVDGDLVLVVRSDTPDYQGIIQILFLFPISFFLFFFFLIFFIPYYFLLTNSLSSHPPSPISHLPPPSSTIPFEQDFMSALLPVH